MAEIVVVGIDNAYDANRVLAEMNDMGSGGPERDGEDGVAGLLVADSSMQARLGPRASGGDISGPLYDCGVEEGFVLSLAQMLEDDAAAALFLVVRKSQTGQVLEELSGFPGRVLRSSFSVDQIPRLRRALSDVCAASR